MCSFGKYRPPPPLLEPQSNLEFSFQGVNAVSPPPPHTLESPLFFHLVGYP